MNMSYPRWRVIVSFIVCFLVFFISTTAIRIVLYLLMASLKNTWFLHFLINSLYLSEFGVESVATVVGCTASYTVLCKLIPNAEGQQGKCIFVFGIILLIFGIFNFFPSFIEGFDKSGRVAGIIQMILGISLVRIRKT